MFPIVPFDERHHRLSAIMSRQASHDPGVAQAVSRILDDVRERGDRALADFARQFDAVVPDPLKIDPASLEEAYRSVDPSLMAIIRDAAGNIRRFHERQRQASWFVEDGDGVILGQRIMPLERVGLYVPGGQAFYPSSLLMNAIPAQVAGVTDIQLVSPPQADGRPHVLVMATAHFLGLRDVYAVGGAQAVAALAFGTETIRRVDKIVGPGNAWVAEAKRQVYGPVAIDSIAGPTEIVILADATAAPEFVAADMIAQAEHDERASAILVTTDAGLAESTRERVEALVRNHPRRTILEVSLSKYSAIIVAEHLEEAIQAVNELAAEHLEVMVADPWGVLPEIHHAGAIFLGAYSAEPVGDYYAGPNHVLPTGGTARYASALGVEDFVRRQSIISYTQRRLERTGKDIATFARAESLPGHAHAIEVRMGRHGTENGPEQA